MKSTDQPVVGEILQVRAHETEAAAPSPDEEPVFKEIQSEEILPPETVPLQAAEKDAFSDIPEETTTEIMPEPQKGFAHEGLSEKPVPEYIQETQAAESEEAAGKSESDIHRPEYDVDMSEREMHENISEDVGEKPVRRNMRYPCSFYYPRHYCSRSRVLFLYQFSMEAGDPETHICKTSSASPAGSAKSRADA